MTDTELETAIRNALREHTRPVVHAEIPPFAAAVLEAEPRATLGGGRRRRRGMVLALAGVALAVAAALLVQVSHRDAETPRVRTGRTPNTTALAPFVSRGVALPGQLVDIQEHSGDGVPSNTVEVFRSKDSDATLVALVGMRQDPGQQFVRGESVVVRGGDGRWEDFGTHGVLWWFEGSTPVALNVQGVGRNDVIAFVDTLSLRGTRVPDGFRLPTGSHYEVSSEYRAGSPAQVRVATFWYAGNIPGDISLSINETALPADLRDSDLFDLPGSVTDLIDGVRVGHFQQLQARIAWWVDGSTLINIDGGFDLTSLKAIVESFKPVSPDEWVALRRSLSDHIAALPVLRRVQLGPVTMTAHGNDAARPDGYCLAIGTDQVCKPPIGPETSGTQRFLFEADVLINNQWWHFGHDAAGRSTLRYEPSTVAVETFQKLAAGETYFASRIPDDRTTLTFNYVSNATEVANQELTRPN